jgi:amidophosphoribosyltransferase
MLMMQKRAAGCGRRQAKVVAASSVASIGPVRRRAAAGTPGAAHANLSSFMNAGALKVKVAVGNARMSRAIGGGAKAYKRCVRPWGGVLRGAGAPAPPGTDMAAALALHGRAVQTRRHARCP